MIQKAKTQFTRGLLVLVCILGITSILSLINEPLQTDVEEVTTTDWQPQQARGVASMVQPTAPNPISEVFEVDCSGSIQNFETTSSRIRLKGANCQTGPGINTAQIKNSSNGFVATVFHQTPSSFTTDYINLSEGTNEIQLNFQNEKGNSERKISVVRKPASNAQPTR